jgi:small multidrug resistance pump
VSLDWLLLLAAIVVSMCGQFLLKAGAGAESVAQQILDWHTIVGLGLYGGAALLYILALRRIPVSVALPSTALSYVVAAIVGHYVFGEAVGAMHIAALTLILGGVILLAFT